ncbi:hypothetical protein CCR75_005342 [Bremia lactucae]|uniref:Uncharacterized protein n=1 Tax=Bremia lactucae TaxID=4779 RepID=A0A976FIP2_BRELC|nr:hypothetical protein CCR75_005342 [Bremia lactucae]
MQPMRELEDVADISSIMFCYSAAAVFTYRPQRILQIFKLRWIPLRRALRLVSEIDAQEHQQNARGRAGQMD